MTKRTRQQHSDVFRFVSGVSYSARTSQETIEELATLTVKTLGKLNQQLAEATAHGEKFLAEIVETDPHFPLEIEEEITSNLLAAEHNLAEALEHFQEKEHAAICDSDLYGRNEEMVTEAYRRAMELLAALSAVTQGIRWAVMERAEDYGETESGPLKAEAFLALRSTLLLIGEHKHFD